MRATLDGAPLAGKLYDKVLALLAYLAVESGRRHSREWLAELLWPGLPPDTARTNLRQALYHLRCALNKGSFLLVSRDQVGFAVASPHWLDVAEFTAPPAPCPSCDAHSMPAPCPSCIDRLEQAAALYQGEFLTGLTLDDAPEFELWREGWRDSLCREALALHERVRRCHELSGQPERALLHARRYTELAPWDEGGHRQLMRLLAEYGQRGAALAHYESCRLVLARELEVPPAAATRLLMESIRDGAFESAADAQAIGVRPEGVAEGSMTGSSASISPMPVSTRQRRPVTLLYCDLGLEDERDPDEFADRLNVPRQRCAAIARQHGGHVTLTHDGSMLAYFGYPVAFEDAALRAVRSAQAIADEIHAPILVRAGIHTGVIVAGDDPQLPDSAGIAPAAARRLSEFAAHGELVVDESTRILVEGYFRLQRRSRLRGTPSPQTYRVGRGTGAASRLAASLRLSPLAGRQTELTLLHERWQATSRGQGGLLLIRGDAGLGKSRLIHALREHLAGTASHARELYCFPEYRSTPLYPVVALLETILGLASEDPPEMRLDKLSSYMARHHSSLFDSAVPVLAPLLSAAVSGETGVSPQQHKHRLLATLRDLLANLAAREPLLLILEDAHWVDPSTLEVLEQLGDWSARMPVLILLTARSEFRPAWIPPAAILELSPLEHAEVAQLVASVDASLPTATVARIVARADGVPLFAEAMAQMATGPSDTDIPPTLQYLLLAQFDALGEARGVAQLAATIGREFDRELLAHAVDAEAIDLDAALDRLQKARLITAIGDSSDAWFEFRHALIQEAAYDSQPRGDRRAAHRRIAGALESHFPRRAAQHPEQLARHYTSADAAAEAIPWWLVAGRRALHTFANREAADHLRAGLALIAVLPADERRNELELDLLLPLGQALLTLYGYGSVEATRVYDRAFALCSDQAPNPRRFEALWGLWMVSSSRHDSGFSASAALSDELRHNAEACGSPVLCSAAYSASANIALWRGHLEPACRYAEAAVAQWRTFHSAQPGESMDGHDPRVASLAHLSWARFAQGREEEALEVSQRALELAKTLNDPDSLGFALFFAATLHRFIYDAASTEHYALEASELAERYRMPLWRGTSELLLGWAQAFAGDASGVDRAAAAVAELRTIMPGVVVAFLHALAEAHGFLERNDAQLRVVEEALCIAEQVDEHFHRADLYRLRGECLQRLGQSDAALASLRTALEIAEGQDAQARVVRISAALATAQGRELEAC